MRQEKKKYLSSYLLQETKINRIRNMSVVNPELKAKYDKELKEVLDLRLKIEKQIAKVDGGILSELLCQKYIFGKTLEDISHKKLVDLIQEDISLVLNYSTRHIERLHIKALDKFEM